MFGQAYYRCIICLAEWHCVGWVGDTKLKWVRASGCVEFSHHGIPQPAGTPVNLNPRPCCVQEKAALKQGLPNCQEPHAARHAECWCSKRYYRHKPCCTVPIPIYQILTLHYIWLEKPQAIATSHTQYSTFPLHFQVTTSAVYHKTWALVFSIHAYNIHVTKEYKFHIKNK